MGLICVRAALQSVALHFLPPARKKWGKVDSEGRPFVRRGVSLRVGGMCILYVGATIGRPRLHGGNRSVRTRHAVSLRGVRYTFKPAVGATCGRPFLRGCNCLVAAGRRGRRPLPGMVPWAFVRREPIGVGHRGSPLRGTREPPPSRRSQTHRSFPHKKPPPSCLSPPSMLY